MTREGKWPLAAAVAVVLAAGLLAACGGSNSDDSDSTTAATTTGATTNAQGDDGGQGQGDRSQSGSQDQQGADDRGQSQGSPDDRQGGSGDSKNVAAPLQVSGGGSEQFRTKGGDNSIQEFGEEAESELQEVAEIVHGFYAARAEEEWETACSYLAKTNVEQLVQIASQSPQLKGAGCGVALKAFTRPLPPSVNREVTTVDAGSFRREGSQGFLMYYGTGHTPYAMPLREEGGSWKVAALSGTTLG